MGSKKIKVWYQIIFKENFGLFQFHLILDLSNSILRGAHLTLEHWEEILKAQICNIQDTFQEKTKTD